MAATRILIVDDHPLFREALKQAVSGGVANASVTLAGSLEAATALLDKDDDFDLVLLDLRMPGVQGLSGLIYLRAQYPNVPVAIITASDDHGLVQKALNLNASGFIPKTSGIETMRPRSARLVTPKPRSVSCRSGTGSARGRRPSLAERAAPAPAAWPLTMQAGWLRV